MSNNETHSVPPLVLIVDDEADVRDHVGALLENGGYRVVAARNGVDALAWLERGGRPSVILLDLVMPGMDGHAFAEAIEGDRELSRIPLLVFSGHAESAPKRAAIVLPKPSTSVDLLDAVGKLTAHERRESPRFAVRFDVIADDGRSRSAARAINLSRGGLRFRSPTGATVGQPLALSLRIGAGDVVVDGEVRNVQFEHSGWDIGARFTSVKAGGPALEQLIQQMEAGAPFGNA
jgi:CheY-like chemotaxis protein